MTKFYTIGVLGLQGCVSPHKPHIEAMGDCFKIVKTKKDIDEVDALILPGGESTTMLRLINTFNLKKNLETFFRYRPVWGICAGAILMARDVTNPPQESFDLLNITAERNAYGRQLESIQQVIDGYPVSYIRAPRLSCSDPEVTIHAWRGDDPVWLEKKNYMATTFHPEMTLEFPSPMHMKFREIIREAIQ